jgi:hypothetical protein
MSVNQLFAAGSLAQAAYANLSGQIDRAVLADRLQIRDRGDFTFTQAREFAERYSVVTQYDDDAAVPGATGTSLSANVFRDEEGQLTQAIRGTLEAQGDIFPTDVMLATRGVGTVGADGERTNALTITQMVAKPISVQAAQ